MYRSLRKALGSVISRSYSSTSADFGNEDDDNSAANASGMVGGAEQASPFERISADILYCIFSLLPGHDLAAASIVCKAWSSIIQGSESLWRNVLAAKAGSTWSLVLFAETSLRSLPPFATSNDGLDSFQRIYGARQQVPCSVVIDGGSGYCKYGWSNFNKPTGRFPTFLAYGNIENPIYSSLMDFFTTVYERLAAKPALQPLVISTPICHYDDTEVAIACRRNLLHITHKVLFSMGVKAICAVDQAVLALIASKQTSGIVVNIGFQLTSVVPIYRGKIMRKAGVEVIGQGALQLTARLCELMQRSGISFENITVVKALKEKLCYVAEDYDRELCRHTEASCTLDSYGEFTLNHERFMACEIMFQPYLGGLRTMSIQQAVALCIEHCMEISNCNDMWFNTVVLAGGSASLPGLGERLKKELCKLLPQRISKTLNVISQSNGADLAWHGAKLLSNSLCR
ncbi:hypothetical protein KP509_20G066800 [Ceratopteris richardii]|uniref:F-box domain-containing protein n=1 Tax=Ceratopteris richardii TaxID=49495 RepID=A0A8T2SFZ7_CERRI|nr:hypothetical protein KP509_20G066800 [Ceratopteris richardii]